MENYTEILRSYLKGRRNVKRRIYKIMSSAYRAVENERTTWEIFEKQLRSTN